MTQNIGTYAIPFPNRGFIHSFDINTELFFLLFHFASDVIKITNMLINPGERQKTDTTCNFFAAKNTKKTTPARF